MPTILAANCPSLKLENSGSFKRNSKSWKVLQKQSSFGSKSKPLEVATPVGAHSEANAGAESAVGAATARKPNFKSVAKEVIMLNTAVEMMRAHSFAENEHKAAQKAAKRSILTEASKRTLAATPLEKQGNTAVYSKHSVAQRKKLRNEREVVAELQLWWDSDMLEKRQSTSTSDGKCITKYEFFRFLTCLNKIVSPDTPPMSAEHLQKEWRQDVHGAAYMGKERLHDSVFELADIWCMSCDKAEYLAFLRDLRPKVEKSLPTTTLSQDALELFRDKWGAATARTLAPSAGASSSAAAASNEPWSSAYNQLRQSGGSVWRTMKAAAGLSSPDKAGAGARRTRRHSEPFGEKFTSITPSSPPVAPFGGQTDASCISPKSPSASFDGTNPAARRTRRASTPAISSIVKGAMQKINARNSVEEILPGEDDIGMENAAVIHQHKGLNAVLDMRRRTGRTTLVVA